LSIRTISDASADGINRFLSFHAVFSFICFRLNKMIPLEEEKALLASEFSLIYHQAQTTALV
jgi:hypothetical protein